MSEKITQETLDFFTEQLNERFGLDSVVIVASKNGHTYTGIHMKAGAAADCAAVMACVVDVMHDRWSHGKLRIWVHPENGEPFQPTDDITVDSYSMRPVDTPASTTPGEPTA